MAWRGVRLGSGELGCCGSGAMRPPRSDIPLHLPLQRLQHNTTPHGIRRPDPSERISATRLHKHKHVHLPTSSQTETPSTEETQLSRSISLGPQRLIGPLAESPSRGTSAGWSRAAQDSQRLLLWSFIQVSVIFCKYRTLRTVAAAALHAIAVLMLMGCHPAEGREGLGLPSSGVPLHPPSHSWPGRGRNTKNRI